MESVLSFERNGDDGGRLSLTSSVENKFSSGFVTIVPSGLDEEPSGMDIAGLGDGPTVFN